MGKTLKKTDNIITLILFAIYLASVVFLLFSLPKLPSLIGVYFDGNGRFSLYGSHWYAMYGAILGFGGFIFAEIVSYAAHTTPYDHTISEFENNCRDVAYITMLIVHKILITEWALFWNVAIAKQTNMFVDSIAGTMLLILILWIVFFTYMLITKIKHKKKTSI